MFANVSGVVPGGVVTRSIPVSGKFWPLQRFTLYGPTTLEGLQAAVIGSGGRQRRIAEEKASP